MAGKAEVYNAPTDVQLSDVDIVEPDLMIVSAARSRIISPSRIIGPPDVVVEILSPSNARHDLELKRKLYELREVPIYWIVDPEAQTVTVLELDADGVYREAGSFHEEVRLQYGDLQATMDLRRVW